jgi:peptide chain release factor 1
VGESLVLRLEPRLREMAARIEDLDRRLSDPAVASDASKANPLMRERVDLAKRTAPYAAWRAVRARLMENEAAAKAETDPSMVELFRAESAELSARLSELEKEVVDLFFTGDEDSDRDVILEVRAGTGGEEAALFARDLVRMYTRYADRKGWKVEPLSESPTDLGGFREAIVRVVGEDVFGRLRYESGGSSKGASIRRRRPSPCFRRRRRSKSRSATPTFASTPIAPRARAGNTSTRRLPPSA